VHVQAELTAASRHEHLVDLEVLSLMSWKLPNQGAEGRRGVRRMPKILVALLRTAHDDGGPRAAAFVEVRVAD
jgi:hypothetical protein